MLCVCTLQGLTLGKAAWNEAAVIQVTEAPVSKSYEKVFPPALAVTLGLTLSPLKGVIWLNILLQVAIEMAHKFKINWGMSMHEGSHDALYWKTEPTSLLGSLFERTELVASKVDLIFGQNNCPLLSMHGLLSQILFLHSCWVWFKIFQNAQNLPFMDAFDPWFCIAGLFLKFSWGQKGCLFMSMQGSFSLIHFQHSCWVWPLILQKMQNLPLRELFHCGPGFCLLLVLFEW